MSRTSHLVRLSAALLSTFGGGLPAPAQQSGQNFTYHSPGVMTFAGDVGVKDRRVFFPTMKFPLRAGPEAGADGQALRAFANSQVFIPAHFGGNDPRLYAYPWTDTLCESKHRGGPMPVCPTRPRAHQGVDIRPNAPTDKAFDVVAWADGVVTFVQGTGTSEVNIRSAANDGTECVYLHLRPAGITVGQPVKKGDVIGKVSNLMTGGGTSIHLHFECKATHPELRQKVKVPVYSSLVASYRREWTFPDLIEEGVLLRDPEREIDAASMPSGGAVCDEPLAEALAAQKDRSFKARYTHNCSEMGLAVDEVQGQAELVYVRPRQSLAAAAARNPVFVSGALTTSGDFVGQATSFNLACQDPKFKVAGRIDLKDLEIVLRGDRMVLDAACRPTKVANEALRFAKVGDNGPAPKSDPPPAAGSFACPFALPPGQEPKVVGGKEIPPKSERACNFTALTVPGGLTFNRMPRYIREWPGIRTDILIDKFKDQIITFQTAEAGVGAWWYWLTQRAQNGPGLAKRGYGPTGKATFAAVSRSIAGPDRTEDYVRKTYLAPYLAFASEYFGRTIGESEQLDLSDADVRWNIGRTMFRLESGRTPVVSRRQFDCGIRFGGDIMDDFGRAGVENSQSGTVTFQTFRGLPFYTADCEKAGIPDTPSDPASDTKAKLTKALEQIQILTARAAQLSQDKTVCAERLDGADKQVVDLQKRIAELTSAVPIGQVGVEANQGDLIAQLRGLDRELKLTNQMFDIQREICKFDRTR